MATIGRRHPGAKPARDDSGYIRVQLYDPNRPGATQELQFNLSDPANKKIDGGETDGKACRGFFIDLEEGRPYTPADPTIAGSSRLVDLHRYPPL
jgi:hypothetical protein